MHVHVVTRVHAVTPKLVICVMYFNVNFDKHKCSFIEYHHA